MIRPGDIRRLAAIDIFLLGFKLVLAEYLVGVFLSAGLGAFILARARSLGVVVLGVYILCLGINYVPLLAYTWAIGNRQDARAALGDESDDKPAAMSKYRRLSLLLLIPLVVAVLAAIQSLSRADEVAPRPQ